MDNSMDKLKDMATAFAASIPPHLGRLTTPPLDWHQEGEILTVILADGRKFSASIQEINALMFKQNGGAGIPPVRPGKSVVIIQPPAAASPALPATKHATPRGGKKK